MYDEIINNWKYEIENLNTNGFSRKVFSTDFFPMQSRYYPHSLAWKVNFNFEDDISNSIYSNTTNPYSDVAKEKWHKELEDRFTKMFWSPADEVMPTRGGMSGETKFENSRVDYMTNQGYRFIIQFYPEGFLSMLREEKLEAIGI